MRAFNPNFTRAAKIFDPNFMRAGRKAARPRGKILSSERVLRGDEILNGGEILSGLALNVGKILSDSGIFSSGKIWSDSKILNGSEILRDCEISSGSGILNETSRSGTQRGFFRWVLRELRAEASPFRLLCKFQSASSSQIDYKFKRVVALQTDRKFKMAASLRVAYKFKASMQKFHRGFCAAGAFSSKIPQRDRAAQLLKISKPAVCDQAIKISGRDERNGRGQSVCAVKISNLGCRTFAIKIWGRAECDPTAKISKCGSRICAIKI